MKKPFLKILIIIISFIAIWVLKDKFERRESDKVGYLVINEKRNDIERIVELPEDVVSRIDYDEERRTYIYVRNKEDGAVVEEMSEEAGILFDIPQSKILEGIEEKEDEIIVRVQYMEDPKKFSFVYDNMLYVYDYEQEVPEEIVPVDYPAHEWRGQDEVIITITDTRNMIAGKLMLWNSSKHTAEEIQQNIFDFIIDDDSEKIYCVRGWIRDSFLLDFSIYELSFDRDEAKRLVKSCRRDTIMKLDPQKNLLIYCNVNEQGDKCKVWSIDLDTGRRKKLGSTYTQIKGLIFHDD